MLEVQLENAATQVAPVARLCLKKILFATDFSQYSHAAFPFALALARKYESKLYAVHVLPRAYPSPILPYMWNSYVEFPESQAWKQMGELALRCGTVPCEAFVPHGDVWAVIAEFIKSQKIDLIVTGIHGHTGIRRLFLVGSSAERIFRCASCPVLTVGPQVSEDPERTAEIRQILFATDFGPSALAAMSYAFSLAQENEACLSLMHVIEDAKAAAKDPKQSVVEVLNRLDLMIPSEASLWCWARTFVEYGPAVERILSAANERNADMIVLGVKKTGHPTAASHLATSTAYQIAMQASCPVLIVHA
jgi:nucleotide-binding universal stress UspA family protein